MLIPTFSWNWSGLDDSADGPFSSVTATWTEPPIQPAGATFTDAAFWVGLDGDNSDTVEQIGTEGYSEGAVGYDAWFEMYPAGPVTIDLSIRPGDVVTGTVVEMGVATLTLSLVDHTSGKSFQTTQSPTAPPARASAEVIAEAPTDDMDDVVALGGFGLVQFTDCSFNGRPIGSYDLNQIDMYSDDNGRLADRTLSLSADGAGFAVTTDVTAPTTEVTGAAPVWHDRAQTLRFKATDNPGGQGLAYTEYSFDGGVSWTRGDAATVAAPGDHSADGVRRVVYRSVDVVGNVEARRLCRVLIDTRQPRPVANWRATARRGSDATLRYLIDDPRPGSPTATATIRISDARGELVKKAVLRAVRVDTPVLDVRLPAAQGHVPLHGDGHRRRRQAWRDILLQHAGGALMSTAWGAAERPEVRHRRKALRRGSKMKRAWLVVCIAVVAAASAAVCATPASALVPDGTHGWFWQMPQPAGGLAGFSALAFPDAGNLWAVGAGGLVLHSTDAGGTWAAQSTGTDADLWSVSFSDDRHGWACGGPVAGAGGAIVGTTDGGATWRNETPAGLKETLTDVSFVDAVHGWIGTTDDHVLRTTDGGATWARLKIGVVPPPSDDEDDDYGTSGYVQVDFASALRGWASTGSGLSITTDGGKTWMPLFDTLSRDMVVAQIDFVDPTHGWVLAYSETMAARASSRRATVGSRGARYRPETRTWATSTRRAPLKSGCSMAARRPSSTSATSTSG